MGFFVACAVIVCLVSVSNTAPLACEDLTRSLDQVVPRQLEGRWAAVAGSYSDLQNLEVFKQAESVSVNVSSTSENRIFYTRSVRLNNNCHHFHFNISVEGSSFTYDGIGNDSLSANFFQTSCQDCMLMQVKEQSGKVLRIALVSRRRQLEQKEMDEFTAQVKCLNLPPPVFKDPTKELCPAEIAGDPAAPREEKTEGQDN